MVPKFLGGPGIGLGDHPFGQDDIGRDYFSLVMKGTQRSIQVMFVIGFFAAIIGTVVGAIAGYYRGVVDNVLMRFTDFIITIPAVIVGSVIGSKFGNLGAIVLAVYLGLFAWTGLSRLVRGEFLTLREREFVDAARVAGYAPSLTVCSSCEAPGPHNFFSLQGGGCVCLSCKPSASAAPSQATLDLMADLLTGDWERAVKSEAKNRNEASGLIAAYLQRHLERGLRSLPLVERISRG